MHPLEKDNVRWRWKSTTKGCWGHPGEGDQILLGTLERRHREGSEAESELQVDISIQEEGDQDSGSCMSQLGPREAVDGDCTLFMCPKRDR